LAPASFNDSRRLRAEIAQGKSAKKKEGAEPSFWVGICCLANDEYGNTHFRMQDVEQEVLAIDFVDVAVIIVRPVGRPRLRELPGVAAVNDYGLLHVHDLISLYVKVVLPAKVRPELIVGNTPAAIGCRTVIIAVHIAVATIISGALIALLVLRAIRLRAIAVVVTLIVAGVLIFLPPLFISLAIVVVGARLVLLWTLIWPGLVLPVLVLACAVVFGPIVLGS
jgi:hypothetical protein